MHSTSFNVLILLSSPAHALALLTDRVGAGFRPLQYVKLLGPPLCGRWVSSDLAKHVVDVDVSSLALVDQCGTLLPFLFN